MTGRLPQKYTHLKLYAADIILLNYMCLLPGQCRYICDM